MIKKDQSLFKQLVPHIIAIVFFLAITMIYFSPLLDGKMLPQSDVTQFQGASQELRDYYNKEGGSSAWTGAMFSGMPSYQIGIWGGSPNFLDYLEMPLKALGSNSAGAVFVGMLMAYILFCIMGFGPVASILGAVAYSLSSYNIVILEAGHVTKAWALAYMPLIVAGIMALFKNKILLAGLLVALGLALQIKNNHLQMTYYTGIFCFVLFVGYAVERITQKDIKSLLKACGVMVVALALAALCNMGNIYSNLEMARESTRGKSELSAPTDSEKQSSGLDKDYAFGWSYGKAETFTLMIPNVHGGVSRPFDDQSESYKILINTLQSGKISEQDANALFGRGTQYWGDQPFTQGSVYFGVIICFLFLLGMIIIRSKVKWAIFIGTVLFIFLAWGKNLEWFNDIFFYHFPLYNKFRAVSTALVIPALSMVMIAVWGVKEFFSGEIDKAKLTKAFYISIGVVGGLCLLFWLMPNAFFNFTSVMDEQRGLNIVPEYYQAILEQRKELLRTDALRSLGFVLLAGAVLFFSLRTKMEKQKVVLYASVALIVLVLVDLWGVDKRYLNNDTFVSKTKYQTETFTQSAADKAILADTHPSYRVLNLNDPFQETKTSYYHKSIGGYHAAKLKRYQELIDYRLGMEVGTMQREINSNLQKVYAGLQANPPAEGVNPQQLMILAVQDSIRPALEEMVALNMLNVKYIIFHPEFPVFTNPEALGNAWFVSDYKLVDNADEEIAEITSLWNPKETAIIDKRFESEVSGLQLTTDSAAAIQLTDYKPNILKYSSKANSEQLAVFSEIYFSDGWQAYIDGKEVPHFRADWTLRAMRIPAGEHEIIFKFEPQGYDNSRMLATASSGILVLLLIGMVVLAFIRNKKETEQ
ncbi:MAG: YfhO family protein [Prevotella sp.]|jgi:hypothetical protein|nr:YfhO family protein [Prevotella sp.]